MLKLIIYQLMNQKQLHLMKKYASESINNIIEIIFHYFLIFLKSQL